MLQRTIEELDFSLSSLLSYPSFLTILKFRDCLLNLWTSKKNLNTSKKSNFVRLDITPQLFKEPVFAIRSCTGWTGLAECSVCLSSFILFHWNLSCQNDSSRPIITSCCIWQHFSSCLSVIYWLFVLFSCILHSCISYTANWKLTLRFYLPLWFEFLYFALHVQKFNESRLFPPALVM